MLSSVDLPWCRSWSEPKVMEYSYKNVHGSFWWSCVNYQLRVFRSLLYYMNLYVPEEKRKCFLQGPHAEADTHSWQNSRDAHWDWIGTQWRSTDSVTCCRGSQFCNNGCKVQTPFESTNLQQIFHHRTEVNELVKWAVKSSQCLWPQSCLALLYRLL